MNPAIDPAKEPFIPFYQKFSFESFVSQMNVCYLRNS